MKTAVLFPGQGAQQEGFLRALPLVPAVEETLQEASSFLSRDAREMDVGSALSSTVTTQLALTIAGVAFARFLASEEIAVSAVAGMSVGAYSAAVAAGCIDLASALHLVALRARWMESVFPPGTRGMAVIEGLRLRAVEALLEGTDATIANYNTTSQYVIAGRLPELNALIERAIEQGAYTAKLLRMSVASHCTELMDAGAQLLEEARTRIFQRPQVTFYSSRTARVLMTEDAVREELALNMASPVRWNDTVVSMASTGVECFLESPPGHTLTHLCAQIVPDAIALAAADMRWDVVVRRAARF